jgi:hypothetical protein
VIARTAFSSQRSVGDVTTFMPSEPFDDIENGGPAGSPVARKFWNPPLSTGRPYRSTRDLLGRYVRGLGFDRMDGSEADREPVPGVDGRDQHGQIDRLGFRKLRANVFIDVIGSVGFRD